jgi:hypothetical protein
MKIALIIIGALIAIFFIVAAIGRKKPRGKSAEMLYPYVIPQTYLENNQAVVNGIVRPLGHGLLVSLVFDLDGLVQSVTAEDLARMNMTADQAHQRALQNLELLAGTNVVKFTVFPDGPSGQPLVLVGGHWAAATSILLPGLKGLVEGALGTSDILISIPHREAMLLFPQGDRVHRDALRAMVKEKESDGRKPLTFELFALGDEGVVTFVEKY